MVDSIDLVLPAPRTRGRAPAPARVTYVRDLSLADIESLGPERGIQPPAIKRLRDSHHTVAKLLAIGHRPGQVAEATGYSISRISILQSDPAFQDLLAFYRDNQSEEFLRQKAALDERMLDVALDAVSLIQERIDEDPDSITNNMALEITKAFADRTGYAPVTKSVSVNASVDLGSRLSAARERLKTIDSGPAHNGRSVGEANDIRRAGPDPTSGVSSHQHSPGGDPTQATIMNQQPREVADTPETEVGLGNEDNAPHANKSGIALAPESAAQPVGDPPCLTPANGNSGANRPLPSWVRPQIEFIPSSVDPTAKRGDP